MNGRKILKITEVNQSLSKWFQFSNQSLCEYGSCSSLDYKFEMKEVYNSSLNGKKLVLIEARVYNESSSFEFKILSYFAETALYNFSLITRIIRIDEENYFSTAINLAPKENKLAPFADLIEIKSKAKLSEHYRILAEVLNEIRKKDETSWVWNKAKNELGYLSRVLEKNLTNYNVEGRGNAFVMDLNWNSLLCDACKWLITQLCSGAISRGCLVGCISLCSRIPHPIGIVACSGICYVLCRYSTKELCESPSDLICKRAGYCG
ncbi:MAG: halocin C8-like domain-containing protein [Archaeoglobaceae archaeon]|nr:halocin C8-like domain-containing protein [Archaeoglobaceae archaeon]MDW8128028.1 halocin C8-like domain-containing protein [Archaeoglobaceae archaeon]